MMLSEFRLTITTSNAAFWTDDGETFDAGEVARILREVADNLDGYGHPIHAQSVHDINGNRVGQYKFYDESGDSAR
jgi:hypothetical protein